MRRLLAAGAAGLALVLAAPVAGAQDSSRWQSTVLHKSRQASETIDIRVRFQHRSYNANLQSFSHRVWVTVPSGLPSGCGASGEVEIPSSGKDFGPGPVANSTDAWATFSTSCNGSYGFRMIAEIDRGILGGGTDRSPTVTGTIDVVVPPAEVPSGAAAARDGNVARLAWPAVTDQPPDFLGYRIERATADDTWEVAGNVRRDTRTFTDTEPIGPGGAAYRIRSRRAGPNGEILSDGRVVTIAGDGTTSTSAPGTDGGTEGPGTDGGTSVPGTDGGTGEGGTGGEGGAAGPGIVPRTGPQPRGTTGVGTRAPRLGQPSQANFPPLLTPADDFQETIDYGDRTLAGEEGEDELSSLFYEEDTGRGMAVPVATGFVLAAWAFHLRFLAKAAKPVPVTTVPAHGRRRSGSGRPAPDRGFGPPLDPEPFLEPEPLLEPALLLEPEPYLEPEPAVVRYEPPAHYRPPSLTERYDPFAR